MEESLDVKALMAKFSAKAHAREEIARDNGPHNYPAPGFARGGLSRPGVTENGRLQNKMLPMVTPKPPGQSPVRFPRSPMAEQRGYSPPRSQLPPERFPRTAQSPGSDTSSQALDSGKIRLTGQLLQNMMLVQQRPQSLQLPPSAPSPGAVRQPPGRRSIAEATPLRRPLPPEGPLPMKPKRPPNVNLKPYLRSPKAPQPSPAHPGLKENDGSQGFGGRKMSLPGSVLPPGVPRPPPKPTPTPQLRSDHREENEDTYDDIGSTDQRDSWAEKGSQHTTWASDDSEVYDSINEDEPNVSRPNVPVKSQSPSKKNQEENPKEKKERQKRQNELRKKFQLKGEVEVIHTARVRHDWQGRKLDLSVREGENVEIIRVKNNPGGKWLARTLSGKYGYISNTCVDIDYEEVKRRALQSQRLDNPLPPPLPDPLPPRVRLDVPSHCTDSVPQGDDYYDDVQTMHEDFPPPPPEICMDPAVERELKKKFKLEGPVKVLHTMMVDPNGVIRRPGGKDLPVAQGEILDVIQLGGDKRALCRNQFGKYGYVSKSLLLQMEGDIYDDIDHFHDVYDNDSAH